MQRVGSWQSLEADAALLLNEWQLFIKSFPSHISEQRTIWQVKEEQKVTAQVTYWNRKGYHKHHKFMIKTCLGINNFYIKIQAGCMCVCTCCIYLFKVYMFKGVLLFGHIHQGKPMIFEVPREGSSTTSMKYSMHLQLCHTEECLIPTIDVEGGTFTTLKAIVWRASATWRKRRYKPISMNTDWQKC